MSILHFFDKFAAISSEQNTDRCFPPVHPIDIVKYDLSLFKYVGSQVSKYAKISLINEFISLCLDRYEITLESLPVKLRSSGS